MKTTILILSPLIAVSAFAQGQTPRPTLADASPYVTQMNGGRPVDCTAPKVKIRFGSGRGEGYCQAVLADLVKAWETGKTPTAQEKIMSRAVAGVALLRPLLKDPDSLQIVGVYLRDSKNQGGSLRFAICSGRITVLAVTAASLARRFCATREWKWLKMQADLRARSQM